MGKTYLIADTHFGDAAIWRYEGRPFASVEEMDACLIRNWNETVTSEDRVFLLGDICFYDDEKTKKIISSLNGEKLMIMGNHDQEFRDAKGWLACGMDFVSDWPIMLENWFWLSHEPLYMTRTMPYVNIFGHVHSNPQYYDVTRQSFCVCAERIGYRPILWDEVKQKIKQAGLNQQLERPKERSESRPAEESFANI